MAGNRQPTEVVEANGRKHFTKAELEDRKSRDVKPSEPVKKLTAPKWLPQPLRKEFNALQKQIVDLMPTMVCRSDADTLASWCMVHAQWLQATARLTGCLGQGTANVDEAAKWAGVQNKLFAQSRALARELGLTITSRCELVIPPASRTATAQEESNPILKLIRGGMEREA